MGVGVCGRGLLQDDETALSLLETVGLTELAKRYTLDDAEVSLSRHTPKPHSRNLTGKICSSLHGTCGSCASDLLVTARNGQSEIKCARQLLTARWLVRVR